MIKEEMSKEEFSAKEKTRELLENIIKQTNNMSPEYEMRALCCLISSLISRLYVLCPDDMPEEDIKKSLQELLNHGKEIYEELHNFPENERQENEEKLPSEQGTSPEESSISSKRNKAVLAIVRIADDLLDRFNPKVQEEAGEVMSILYSLIGSFSMQAYHRRPSGESMYSIERDLKKILDTAREEYLKRTDREKDKVKDRS